MFGVPRIQQPVGLTVGEDCLVREHVLSASYYVQTLNIHLMKFAFIAFILSLLSSLTVKYIEVNFNYHEIC